MHISFKITFSVLFFVRRRADKTAQYTPRHHVPHYDLSIIAAGGQEYRGAMCHAKDVLLMSISLGKDKMLAWRLEDSSCHARQGLLWRSSLYVRKVVICFISYEFNIIPVKLALYFLAMQSNQYAPPTSTLWTLKFTQRYDFNLIFLFFVSMFELSCQQFGKNRWLWSLRQKSPRGNASLALDFYPYTKLS